MDRNRETIKRELDAVNKNLTTTRKELIKLNEVKGKLDGKYRKALLAYNNSIKGMLSISVYHT